MRVIKTYLNNENCIQEVDSLSYLTGTFQQAVSGEEMTFSYEDATERNVINIYPDITYQTLYGFGGAITEASGYVYSNLSEENKKKFIDVYYGKAGLGYIFGRCSIDSCDFGLGNYSAKKSPNDKMDLSRDEEYVLKLLSDIYKVKELKMLFAPWSPPEYMKTNGQKNLGGKLKKDCYSEWADYICEYLSEYKKRGIDIFAVDTQNEPNATQPWDSCVYNTEEERCFLEEHLYPAMIRHGLYDVKRLVWDHNRERVFERLDSIVKAVSDEKCVDGVGYHWYSGDHFENLRLIYDKYPHLLSVFTEGCMEKLTDNKKEAFGYALRYAHEIIGCFNNGCNIFIDWNVLLDEHGGPNHKNNFCSAPIMTDCNNDLVINPIYYSIGSFSKYLEFGAKRIAVSTFSKDVETTAWKNPNGETVAVVCNHRDAETELNLRVSGNLIHCVIPPESINTIIL